ncbi:uncharacterized protein LOC143022928 [Oratosquilla oratoria]|uniref:uncharacterized protein LOC143022928 n=1 Tax=Oratosquilla oratoria TaxID=337810 RepID=UPI003F7685EC
MASPDYLEVPKRGAITGYEGSTGPQGGTFANVAMMLCKARSANVISVLSPTEKAMRGMPPPDQLMNGMEDPSQIMRGMEDLEIMIKSMDLTVGPMGRLLKLHTDRDKLEEEREKRRRAERRRRREMEREREKEEAKNRKPAKSKLSFMKRINFKGKGFTGGESGGWNVIKRRMSFLTGTSLTENDDNENEETGAYKVIKRKMSFLRKTDHKENDDDEREETGAYKVIKKRMSFMRRTSINEDDVEEKGDSGAYKAIKKKMKFMRSTSLKDDALERSKAGEYKVINGKKRSTSLKEYNGLETGEPGECKVIRRKMSIMKGVNLKENGTIRGGEAGENKVMKMRMNDVRSTSIKENDVMGGGEAEESKAIKRNVSGMRGVSLKENRATERGEARGSKVMKSDINVMRSASLKENGVIGRNEAGEFKVIKRKMSDMRVVSLRENEATKRGETEKCKEVKRNTNVMRSVSLKENYAMGRDGAGGSKGIKRKVSSMREPNVMERGGAGECKAIKRNTSVMRKASVKEMDVMAYQDRRGGYEQILKVREANQGRDYEESINKGKGHKVYREKEQNAYKGKESNVYKSRDAHMHRETGMKVYKPREKSMYRERELGAYKELRRSVHHENEKKEKNVYRETEMSVYKQKENNTSREKKNSVYRDTGISTYTENRFPGKDSSGEELGSRRTRNIHQMGRVNGMRRLRGRDYYSRIGFRAAAGPRATIRRGRDPAYLSLWRIVLCAVVSSSAMLLPGAGSGFTGVALAQLTDTTSSSEAMTLTSAYASAFASMVNLGAAAGGVFGTVLMIHFGQRKSLLLLFPCILVLWMVIALTTSPLLFVIAKGLLDMGIAISKCAGDTFVAETVHCKHRGRLLGISAVVLRSGVCFVYILGSTGLTWRQIAAINAILTSVPTFIGLLFLHDSPRWLMRKRRTLDSAQSLQFFRGPKYDISEELLEIEDSIKESTSVKEQLRRFLDTSILKRLIWFSLYMIFLAYSGSFTILIYTVPIFRIANASNNFYHGTIILGFVRILGGVTYLIAVDHIGRRVSIAVAFLSCGISMATFSVYFYIQDVLQKTEVITSITWLPLVSLMIFVFFLGYGEPACFLLVNEILPNSFRTTGFSIVVVFHYLGGFSVSYVYPPMRENLGTHVAFAFYTFCCIALATLPYVFLPETKGRTVEEIDKYFRFRRQTQQEFIGIQV